MPGSPQPQIRRPIRYLETDTHRRTAIWQAPTFCGRRDTSESDIRSRRGTPGQACALLSIRMRLHVPSVPLLRPSQNKFASHADGPFRPQPGRVVPFFLIRFITKARDQHIAHPFIQSTSELDTSPVR